MWTFHEFLYIFLPKWDHIIHIVWDFALPPPKFIIDLLS